jgi:hypothetical protein
MAHDPVPQDSMTVVTTFLTHPAPAPVPLTPAEAARRLGITRAALGHAIRRGALASITVLVPQVRVTGEAAEAYRRATRAWHRGRRTGRPRRTSASV